MTTKIYAVVDALGNPVALSLTPGQAADITQAQALLGGLKSRTLCWRTKVMIPTRSSRISMSERLRRSSPRRRTERRRAETDFALYCERNLVERFFNKIKHYRAIATRFDKLASTFLAGVLLVCVLIWLN